MTEHFGLGLFGLGPGLFGSVFGPRSIMPTPAYIYVFFITYEPLFNRSYRSYFVP
jgi:hypothetical protein